MYEYPHGARRLSDALESAASTPARLTELASVLYYDPEQLRHDIIAVANAVAEIIAEKENRSQ